jgi:hypothetical protein
MSTQNTNTNEHANSTTSFAATLLGISTPLRHDPIAQALRGPRRFRFQEEFSGGEWEGVAGLIGTEGID